MQGKMPPQTAASSLGPTIGTYRLTAKPSNGLHKHTPISMSMESNLKEKAKISTFRQKEPFCHGYVREWIRMIMQSRKKKNCGLLTSIEKRSPCIQGFDLKKVKEIEKEEDQVRNKLKFYDDNGELIVDRSTEVGLLNHLTAIAEKDALAANAEGTGENYYCIGSLWQWQREGTLWPTLLINAAINTGKQYGCVAIELSIQGDGGAHSFGVVYEPSPQNYQVLFFDPNEGEWLFKDTDTFLDWIQDYLNTKYKNFLDLVYCHYFTCKE